MRAKTRIPPHSEMLQNQMEMVTEAVEYMVTFLEYCPFCGDARKDSRACVRAEKAVRQV